MFLANMGNIDMTTSWGELGWSFTSTTCSQLCLGRPLCVAWKKSKYFRLCYNPEKRTWLAGKPTMNEDVSPFKKHADFPASYVSELRGVSCYPTVVEDWASIRRYYMILPTRIIPFLGLGINLYFPPRATRIQNLRTEWNMLPKWLQFYPGYVECCLDPICPMFAFSHPNCLPKYGEKWGKSLRMPETFRF